jgi:O-methyltransferase
MSSSKRLLEPSPTLNEWRSQIIPKTRAGPFTMPIKGNKYSISQPFYDLDRAARREPPLFAPPQVFISSFAYHLNWINPMVNNRDKITNSMTPNEHAVYAYLEMIKSMVSATAFNEAELSITPENSVQKNNGKPFDLNLRKGGRDWTLLGATMTGWKRLDNVRKLLTDVIQSNIPGDYIETGVWRGGSSVFARAVITAHGEQEKRVSYVCDSFSGLPPGDRRLDQKDRSWDNTPYLEVPYEIVANNFMKHNVLDHNVVFAKGFFRDSIGPLSKKIKALSIMRLDGDMYESTVDVLYHLYEKLQIGGYVIIDDWFGFPAKTACEDFFQAHGISPEVIPIDNIAAYWKKTEEVEIQYWRYEQSTFK